MEKGKLCEGIKMKMVLDKYLLCAPPGLLCIWSFWRPFRIQQLSKTDFFFKTLPPWRSPEQHSSGVFCLLQVFYPHNSNVLFSNALHSCPWRHNLYSLSYICSTYTVPKSKIKMDRQNNYTSFRIDTHSALTQTL